MDLDGARPFLPPWGHKRLQGVACEREAIGLGYHLLSPGQPASQQWLGHGLQTKLGTAGHGEQIPVPLSPCGRAPSVHSPAASLNRNRCSRGKSFPLAFQCTSQGCLGALGSCDTRLCACVSLVVVVCSEEIAEAPVCRLPNARQPPTSARLLPKDTACGAPLPCSFRCWTNTGVGVGFTFHSSSGAAFLKRWVVANEPTGGSSFIRWGRGMAHGFFLRSAVRIMSLSDMGRKPDTPVLAIGRSGKSLMHFWSPE